MNYKVEQLTKWMTNRIISQFKYKSRSKPSSSLKIITWGHLHIGFAYKMFNFWISPKRFMPKCLSNKGALKNLGTTSLFTCYENFNFDPSNKMFSCDYCLYIILNAHSHSKSGGSIRARSLERNTVFNSWSVYSHIVRYETNSPAIQKQHWHSREAQNETSTLSVR
jgi:hypothetical protein